VKKPLPTSPGGEEFIIVFLDGGDLQIPDSLLSGSVDPKPIIPIGDNNKWNF